MNKSSIYAKMIEFKNNGQDFKDKLFIETLQ